MANVAKLAENMQRIYSVQLGISGAGTCHSPASRETHHTSPGVRAGAGAGAAGAGAAEAAWPLNRRETRLSGGLATDWPVEGAPWRPESGKAGRCRTSHVSNRPPKRSTHLA